MPSWKFQKMSQNASSSLKLPSARYVLKLMLERTIPSAVWYEIPESNRYVSIRRTEHTSGCTSYACNIVSVNLSRARDSSYSTNAQSLNNINSVFADLGRHHFHRNGLGIIKNKSDPWCFSLRECFVFYRSRGKVTYYYEIVNIKLKILFMLNI